MCGVLFCCLDDWRLALTAIGQLSGMLDVAGQFCTVKDCSTSYLPSESFTGLPCKQINRFVPVQSSILTLLYNCVLCLWNNVTLEVAAFKTRWHVVTHDSNPSTWEAEGQELEASLRCTASSRPQLHRETLFCFILFKGEEEEKKEVEERQWGVGQWDAFW